MAVTRTLIKQKTISHLADSFKIALAMRDLEKIRDLWSKNPNLRAWLSGEKFNFGTLRGSNQQSVSTQAVISYFEEAIFCRHDSIIKEIITTIWSGNASLRAWYCGKMIEFGTSAASDQRRLALDKLIDHFQALFSHRPSSILLEILEENPSLKDWFHGQEVNFGTVTLPLRRTISDEQLLNYFKAVLVSHCGTIIWSMWQGNTKLQNAISQLSWDEAKIMLRKVLASATYPSTFMVTYLKGITDAKLIKSVLEDISVKLEDDTTLSRYKCGQIQLLENRLEVLAGQNPRKRKAITDIARGCYKKRKKNTSAELNELVAQLPHVTMMVSSHFFVEKDIGVKLQQVFKSLWGEMGIEQVRKISHGTSYRVNIINLVAYAEFWRKNFCRPGVISDCPYELPIEKVDVPVPANDTLIGPELLSDDLSEHWFEAEFADDSELSLDSQPADLGEQPAFSPPMESPVETSNDNDELTDQYNTEGEFATDAADNFWMLPANYNLSLPAEIFPAGQEVMEQAKQVETLPSLSSTLFGYSYGLTSRPFLTRPLERDDVSLSSSERFLNR